MEILHLAATTEGGAGIGMELYHRALRALGIRSRVLTANVAPLDDRHAVFARPARALHVRVLQRLGLPATDLEKCERAVDRQKRRFPDSRYELFTPPFSDFRPEKHPWFDTADIVALHWTAGCVDWPRFFANVRQPIVQVLHDQHPYLGGFHYEWDAARNPSWRAVESEFRRIKQRALKGHRLGVVANSRWNAERARISGFYESVTPVEAIHYPHFQTDYTDGGGAALRAAHAIDGDTFVIGFACDDLDNERKGFRELLEVLGQLRTDTRRRVLLLSFGRSPSEAIALPADIRSVHLGHLATTTQKANAYAAMDVFIAPSRAEAFGLTALEARSVGTPLIVAPAGGLLEAAGVEGPLESVPFIESPQVLRTAIAKDLDWMLAHPNEAKRIALERRSTLSANHEPKVVARRFADFAQTLAAA